MKRGICTSKGDNSEFIFAKIMPRFGLSIFSEKTAATERLHPHAVLLSILTMKDRLQLCILAPLAKGQQACVMDLCPSCMCVSVTVCVLQLVFQTSSSLKLPIRF